MFAISLGSRCEDEVVFLDTAMAGNEAQVGESGVTGDRVACCVIVWS